VELKAGQILVALAIVVAAGCDSGTDDAGADLGLQATIGLEFVQQRGCPSCHAPDGKGVLSGLDAPMPTTMAYPANLTSDTATGIGGWADIEIVRAMRYGIDDEQSPLCPPMPHFDGTDPTQPAMTDVEAAAIVAYLRTLPPVAHAVPASRCPPIKPPPAADMAVPASPPDDLASHD
jgi:mono/diheme cytochrome c family protein